MGKDSGGGGGGDPMQAVYTGATRTTPLPQGSMPALRTLNMNPYFAQALAQRAAPFSQMTGQAPAGQPGAAGSGVGFANLGTPEQRNGFMDQVRNQWLQTNLQNDPQYQRLNNTFNTLNNQWLAAHRSLPQTNGSPMTQAQANQYLARSAPVSALGGRATDAQQAIDTYRQNRWEPIQRQLDSLLAGNITPEMVLGGLLGGASSANNPYGVRG